MEIRTIIIFKDGKCIQESYIFYAQTINLKNLYSQSDKLKFDGNNCELADDLLCKWEKFDVPKYLLTQNAWQVKTKMNRHTYLLKKGKNYNAYQIISMIYWLLMF